MISVALMCHPKRARFVAELQEQLPDAKAVWDERDDRWDTGSRALRAYDPTASHHVVVQDDGLLCEEFVAGIEKITERVPNNPISLYTGKTRPFGQQVQRVARMARAKRISWIILDGLFWGVGVVLPVPLLEEMLRFHDVANIKISNYDSKMSFYFEREGIKVFYTQPSLVNHRDLADGNPSLVPGRFAKGRVAHNFIGETSPLDVNWDTKALYMAQGGKITSQRLHGAVA